MLTFDVQEQFLLLNPRGRLARVADAAVRAAADPRHVQPQFMPFQVQTATGVCTRLEELRIRLAQWRAQAARGASRAGALLVPVAMPPTNDGWSEQASNSGPYHDLEQRFPQAAASNATCACRVRIGLGDRDVATSVLSRLRPWLAPLLAMSANSPIVHGQDTGWSSRRYVSRLQWPTFRPPPGWRDARGYDRTVRALVDRGAATDVRNVYFLARLSTGRPGVEVHVADTCLTVDDTVLLAATVRALVRTVLDDIHDRVPPDVSPGRRVSRDLLWAAHHGLRAPGDPAERTGTLPPAVQRLFAKIFPVLDSEGEAGEVAGYLAGLRRHGNGANRQRRVWQGTSTPAAYADALSDIGVGAASVS